MLSGAGTDSTVARVALKVAIASLLTLAFGSLNVTTLVETVKQHVCHLRQQVEQVRQHAIENVAGHYFDVTLDHVHNQT